MPSCMEHKPPSSGSILVRRLVKIVNGCRRAGLGNQVGPECPMAKTGDGSSAPASHVPGICAEDAGPGRVTTGPSLERQACH